MGRRVGALVEHARLVCGDHVLDVDEGVVAAVTLKDLQRLLDEVAHVFPLLLAVVDAVTRVQVLVLEDVHDGEDLAVVWDERLAHQVGGHHQVLQDLERGAQHLVVPHAQGVLDGDDELWDDWEDLGASVLQHVVNALACEELIGVGCLA